MPDAPAAFPAVATFRGDRAPGFRHKDPLDQAERTVRAAACGGDVRQELQRLPCGDDHHRATRGTLRLVSPSLQRPRSSRRDAWRARRRLTVLGRTIAGSAPGRDPGDATLAARHTNQRSGHGTDRRADVGACPEHRPDKTSAAARGHEPIRGASTGKTEAPEPGICRPTRNAAAGMSDRAQRRAGPAGTGPMGAAWSGKAAVPVRRIRHASVSQRHVTGRRRGHPCAAGRAARPIAESLPSHVQKSAAISDQVHVARNISARMVGRTER